MPAVGLSSYADMAHGGAYYTYVSKELPKIMRSMFPLSDRREDNFIAGLSMGGAGLPEDRTQQPRELRRNRLLLGRRAEPHQADAARNAPHA